MPHAMKRLVIATLVAHALTLAMAGNASAVMVELPEPVSVRPESLKLLRDASGTDRDEWKLVAFGFTRCKNICPMLIANVSWLMKIAGEEGIPLDGVFVTVDPDRDSDAVLSRFTAPHGDGMSFVRLEGEALDSFKDEFGVEAVFLTKNAGNRVHYQVDHSSMGFLIDPAGRIRVVFDTIDDTKRMVEKLRENPDFFAR